LSEFIASFIQYFSGSQKRRNILFATLILAALAIRVFLLWVPSWDVDSIQSKWYDELIKVGRIDAFAEIFYNYTPAPVYLIDIVTLFRFIPKEPAMKLITVIFDFLGAWGIWKILKLRFPKGSVAWLGFFAFLFLPTVFVESAMWGQTDILFTTFLIWSFYYVLKEKTWPAMFFFAVSFCFKLQSLFLGPLLLILLLRKKLPIYQFLMIPVVYFMSLVPAWIAGAPLKKLLLTYLTQFGTYHELSKRAPNLYAYFGSDIPQYNAIVIGGIILTLILILGYVYLRTFRWKDLGAKSLVYDAALFTFMIPFLLPKMHDRYFYVGSVFLLLLCFYEVRMLGVLILSQIGSLLAFIPYFSGWSPVFVMVGSPFMLLAVIGLVVHFRHFQMELQSTTAAGTG